MLNHGNVPESMSTSLIVPLVKSYKKSLDTLIGETFARETFANFANFGLFRESLSRESFQNGNSRKFIQ